MSETGRRVREDGWIGVRRSGLELGFGLNRRLDALLGWSTNVYDRDWDVLVVLDACRADLMAEVADEYPFLDRTTIRSVAGGSEPWMERTFAEERRSQTAETVYVTANPFSERVLDERWFRNMEEVWRYAWDEELDTVPARAVTDVAIGERREHPEKRLIVHYMQPHHPFVPEPMDAGMDRGEMNPEDPIWRQVADGRADRNEVWEAYRDNLHYVLEDVELLLSNMDANRVVITADHGNAVGEWGCYGHGDIPIRAVREVPWCVTSASDAGSYEPDLTPEEEDLGVEDKLSDLGYK